MAAASSRSRVSRSIATVAVSLALFVAICPALNAQFAIGGGASVQVPPPRNKAATPGKPQPERGAAARGKRIVDTLNKMTPKQRKKLAKAVKHMTPEQRRRLGEILSQPSAASGAVSNGPKRGRSLTH
jgi:hypothetical protein